MLNIKRDSFAAGFASAVVLGAAVWAYFNWSLQGGHIDDSPSGRYTVNILSPMEPAAGGTYVVWLRDKTSSEILRTTSVKLNASESTLPLRGEQVSIQWNAAETFADISIREKFLVRISAPSLAP